MRIQDVPTGCIFRVDECFAVKVNRRQYFMLHGGAGNISGENARADKNVEVVIIEGALNAALEKVYA